MLCEYWILLLPSEEVKESISGGLMKCLEMSAALSGGILAYESFSVDRFNQLTTGGGWDKPVLVDVMSAGKLLGIASAATPNSTKKSLQHPFSLTIPARKSRIASFLMHTCYYKIFLRAVDLLIFSPKITRSRKTIFWEKKHIIKVSIKS